MNGSTLGGTLYSLLVAEDILPGDEPSYELCKLIYVAHPLGAKMIDGPIKMAMSQEREISIPGSPEERVRDAFRREWKKIGADGFISNTKRLSMIYGASAIVWGAKDVDTNEPIPPEKIASLDLYFNCLDPLNTAGSLVLNQDPNAIDFQRPTLVTAAGQKYHPSRSLVYFNESPIYIQYTSSAFGYTGRSVYQRPLYPLKSFIQSMIADDMISRKAGVIVAKMKQAGSIADRAMAVLQGIKRNVVKEAETNNVINITPEESIETLNMQNTDTAQTTARKNILENIAVATPMPAKMLNSESYAEGFGEGTEDAKDVIRFIDGLRQDMQPLYDLFDRIVMYRAWTPEFYETIQNEFPEWKKVPYEKAFYDWVNAFEAVWPSLMVEPESELVGVEEAKHKVIVATMEVLLPQADPENKATIIQWACDNLNENKHLFRHPLNLDYEALANYQPPQPMEEPHEPKPFSSSV